MIRPNCGAGSLGDSYCRNLERILSLGFVTSPRGQDITELLGTVILGKGDEHQLIAMKGLRDVTDSSRTESLYMKAELLWYLSLSERSEFIGMFGSIWNRITNNDGTLNSNYGKQVFGSFAGKNKNLTRYGFALSALLNDRDTRQAIIPYVDDRVYTPECSKDFTCTQLQQFFIRENKLHSLVYIRSSDAVYGLNFDIPWWSIVQQIMYQDLIDSGVRLNGIGTLQISIGSSHIYEKHSNLCIDIISEYHRHDSNYSDLSKCFKSLKIKPGTVLVNRYEGNDSESAVKTGELVESVSHHISDLIKSMDSLPYYQYSPSDRFYRDNIDAEYLREAHFNSPIFRHSRSLMKLYYLHREICEGSPVHNLSDAEKNEIVRYWTTVINKWFDLNFCIIGEESERTEKDV